MATPDAIARRMVGVAVVAASDDCELELPPLAERATPDLPSASVVTTPAGGQSAASEVATTSCSRRRRGRGGVMNTATTAPMSATIAASTNAIVNPSTEGT